MNNFHTYVLIAACIFLSIDIIAQTSLGAIGPNTNPALPQSYKFQEYVFAEPNDEGTCDGTSNSSAKIEDIFFAQTHRHNTEHSFFFLIGHRPALLQVAVTGNGSAPDVQVEGFMNGNSLGTKCLKGPSNLSANIDLDTPDFENYFSVTLPKSWVQMGLELNIIVGNQNQRLEEEELKIGPYTEMNLVRVDQDFLDFNNTPHFAPEIENFLAETASAIPVSVVRYGVFPEELPFPEVVAANETEQLVRLTTQLDKEQFGVPNDGYLNSIAVLSLSNMHRSTNDYLSTVYFGNTLNLAPGGWGGGKNFVSFDFTDVYIHELGHALSLPHWGESAYDIDNPTEWQYLYPYGGENDDGGGRGESWNFIQAIYEFENPVCQFDARGKAGNETSDAMQRNNHCLGDRSNSQSPWDGFGDFSAFAMHHYFIGTDPKSGTVNYRGQEKAYQVSRHDGFPIMSLENNERVYERQVGQKQEESYDERIQIPGEEVLNTDVYLVYGTAHGTQAQGNIVYKPVKFNGTLPPIIDPTDPATIQKLKTGSVYRDILGGTRDMTLKMTYDDGSVLHALIPTHGYTRTEDYGEYYGHFRYDLSNFSLVVPGDKELVRTELYRRPFIVRDPSDKIEGNLLDPEQNINASNFMDGATYVTEYGPNRVKPLGPNSIGNRVWYDANQNGLEDEDENGIAGVKVSLWKDNDGDGVPTDWVGYVTTDQDGYYSHTVSPGVYSAFVWTIDNWDEGGPLHGMIPTDNFTDPDNDIDKDNNGRGFPGGDIHSGTITITRGGEPLNDGDASDDWFDLDPTGNQTVDFGFYCPDSCTDFDGDGFTSNVDCNDNNADINPESSEIVYNGIDDDCNSATRDDDLDGDGFLLADDCDDNNASINLDAAEVLYNGIDDDCNPSTRDNDLDGDGFLLADDCDDNNASINSDAAEVSYNGIDDDCNPSTKDDDLDGDGFLFADDCDDTNPDINPNAEDIADNDLDENCDGMDAVSSSTHDLDGVSINIYPNPAKHKLYVDTELNDLRFTLHDIRGQLIMDGKLTDGQVSLSQLTPGVYTFVLKHISTNQTIVEKIVKE